MNERLLLDGCEAVFRSGGLDGDISSPTIEWWMRFIATPTASNWYRAHNASIVAGYLEHQDLAAEENEVERFFLNVVLMRVLYAHALASAPRLSLGVFAPFGRLLGDPRLGTTGVFMSLSRVLPDRYPAPDSVDAYIGGERGFGRLLDYGVITSRLQPLYEWSALELDQPQLLTLIRGGAPVYAWPYAERQVWQPAHLTPTLRFVRSVTSRRSAPA